jgi:hypothetical protein
MSDNECVWVPWEDVRIMVGDMELVVPDDIKRKILDVLWEKAHPEKH